MRQQTPQGDEKPWTVRDELQVGLDLWNDVKGRVRRGEDVPKELEGALREFQGELFTLAHGPAAGANPFFELLQDMEADELDVTGVRAIKDAEYQERERTRRLGQRDTGYAATAGGAALGPDPMLARPVHGLTRDGRDVLSVTSDPAEKSGAYFLPPVIADQPFKLGEEVTQRMAIASLGEVQGDGTLTDHEGRVWDLKDELAFWNERRDLIRQAMVGIFAELGADHELARVHRRRLAAALN